MERKTAREKALRDEDTELEVLDEELEEQGYDSTESKGGAGEEETRDIKPEYTTGLGSSISRSLEPIEN